MCQTLIYDWKWRLCFITLLQTIPTPRVFVWGDHNMNTPETVKEAALKAPLALAWLNMDCSDYRVTLIWKAAVLHCVQILSLSFANFILFDLYSFPCDHYWSRLSVLEEEMKIWCHLNSGAIIKNLYNWTTKTQVIQLKNGHRTWTDIFQRRYMNGQQLYEKMLNIASH